MTKTTKLDKDIAKLQQAIIDGLEDVKAHDIRVFDTTALTPLFERVMVASGNSNRQTRALAMSIRDKVRDAGFPKPRIGGEENGEWITVDCGAAVAHIMQPEIRRYYNLEEIWGEVPVTGLTLAEKKAAKAEKASAKKAVGKKAAAEAGDEAEVAPVKKPAVKKAAAKPAAAKKAPAKATAAEGAAVPAKKPAAKKAPAKTAAAKPAPRKAVAAKPVSKLVVGEPVKKAAAKTAAKPAAKKAVAAKKPAAKKAAPKSAS